MFFKVFVDGDVVVLEYSRTFQKILEFLSCKVYSIINDFQILMRYNSEYGFIRLMQSPQRRIEKLRGGDRGAPIYIYI